MKKRDFFKRLLGITAAAVVAPKALLADETPKEVLVGDSITQTRTRYFPQAGDYVEGVIYCGSSVAEVNCENNYLRVGDVIRIERNGSFVGPACFVTFTGKDKNSNLTRVRFMSAKYGELSVEKLDFLVVLATAYPEK